MADAVERRALEVVIPIVIPNHIVKADLERKAFTAFVIGFAIGGGRGEFDLISICQAA